jgi:hypothetical protein
MQSQSHQLEREAEETRWQLSGTLDELRGRLTPGRVLDQLLEYAREGAAAEFLGNLRREVRENPMPLVLIGIGIGWLMLASRRTSRAPPARAGSRPVFGNGKPPLNSVPESMQGSELSVTPGPGTATSREDTWVVEAALEPP